MAPSPTTTPANLLLRRQNGNVPPGGSPANDLNMTTIIGISVAGGTLSILVIYLTVVWVKKKWRKQKEAAQGPLEGRESTDPIPISLQRPNHQQPSTDSFNSTLADIKVDPCVALLRPVFSPRVMLMMLHSCRTASYANYLPSPLSHGGSRPAGPIILTQGNIAQSVTSPGSASELTLQGSPTTSSHAHSHRNSSEMYGLPRQLARPHRASHLSKSFSVHDIKPEAEVQSSKPSRVGQQPMGVLDNAVRLTSSQPQQGMVPQTGESEGGPSTPTLARKQSTVRHPGDANHLRPPKGPVPAPGVLQAPSFSHPRDIVSFHEQQGTTPKPFKPFTFQFPRPAPYPPSASSVDSGTRLPALTRAGLQDSPFAALVSAAGLSHSPAPGPMNSDASLPAVPGSPTSPSQFSFNTDLMTYNGGTSHSAANSVDQYRRVDPNSFILSVPSQHSLQVIGGSPLRPEDLESRGLRVGRLKDMNASISSFGTASSDPRAPSWTLETLKENLFAHRRAGSSNGSVSDRSSFNVVDLQFPQDPAAGLSGIASAVRPQSFAINPQNPIEMCTVVETFQPLLPDELGLRKGERLGVLRHFDDQWCIVTRETPRSNPGIGGVPGSNTGVLEIGACPAWVFESRRPPGGFTRPMRSSSLGVTVSMKMPVTAPPVPEPAAPLRPWAEREEVISWSNF
jgi:hypothetical protein